MAKRGPKPRVPRPGHVLAAKELKQELITRYDLDDTDAKLLRYVLDFPDAPMHELAASVGMSRQAADKRTRKPAFLRAKMEMEETCQHHLEKAQRAAARRLLSLIQSKDENIALRAAQAALEPLLSKSTLDVNLPPMITFATRIGEDGGVIREAHVHAVGEAAVQGALGSLAEKPLAHLPNG